MSKTDDLQKHLEFIQGVIERHAHTSFVLKGWSITLVAAVFLLTARGTEPTLAVVAGLLPVFSFWGLDAYYLRQERMYRALYDHVRKGAKMAPDLNGRFSLDAKPFRSAVPGRWRTLLAPSIVGFYATVLSVVIVALALSLHEVYRWLVGFFSVFIMMTSWLRT